MDVETHWEKIYGEKAPDATDKSASVESLGRVTPIPLSCLNASQKGVAHGSVADYTSERNRFLMADQATKWQALGR